MVAILGLITLITPYYIFIWKPALDFQKFCLLSILFMEIHQDFQQSLFAFFIEIISCQKCHWFKHSCYCYGNSLSFTKILVCKHFTAKSVNICPLFWMNEWTNLDAHNFILNDRLKSVETEQNVGLTKCHSYFSWSEVPSDASIANVEVYNCLLLWVWIIIMLISLLKSKWLFLELLHTHQ